MGARESAPQKKWGPALLPAPTAPSEGYAGVRSTLDPAPENRCVTPLLDPGSPAQASLSTEPLPLSRSPIDLPTALPEGSLVFQSFRPALSEPKSLQVKTTRCSAALLGPITLRVPLCSPHRSATSRVALEDDRHIRRLFPAGPGRTRRLFPFPPAEIGPLVTCLFLSPFPVLGRGRDRRPDHLLTMHRSPESGKRKFRLPPCG